MNIIVLGNSLNLVIVASNHYQPQHGYRSLVAVNCVALPLSRLLPVVIIISWRKNIIYLFNIFKHLQYWSANAFQLSADRQAHLKLASWR